MCLPTTRSALVRAATTTMAVPCWSSWKTGMSRLSRSRRSTSKQRGAAMSSRLMPPKPGAIISTAFTISSTSWLARQIGQASMSANRLNSAALPSITGSAAPGPMLPSPSTAEPSVTTATLLPLTVSRDTSSGFFASAALTRPTPGVYAIERSSRFLSGTLEWTSILPPMWSRKVRSLTLWTSTPSTWSAAATSCSAWSASLAEQVTSRTSRSCRDSATSIAVTIPPTWEIAVATDPTIPWSGAVCSRMVIEYDEVVAAMAAPSTVGSVTGKSVGPVAYRRGMTATVRDNPDRQRYEAFLGDELAGFSEYRLREGRITFTHTEVDDAYEGEGIGSQLASAVLDAARDAGLDVYPSCPFIADYIKRHPDRYLDLVPEQVREKYGL